MLKPELFYGFAAIFSNLMIAISARKASLGAEALLADDCGDA